ncbi:MAG: hypothetical protein JWL90_4612 [Chthoniobacteraceae bacterium]|nr:hypothetical protein [Chthoniobacteraceae bacterium]
MPNSAASRLVLGHYSEQVVIETARETLRAAGGHVSCGFVFASADYRPHLADFLELIQLHGHVPILAGCSGVGLVGTGAEAEGATGFSLLLLDLPETELHTVELTAADTENSTATPDYWHRITGVRDVDAWTVLADPTAFPVEPWLNEWNAAYPGVASIGGISSGGKRGDDIFLMRDRHIIEGAVAIGYKGGVRIETLVSQGCRPIGEPFTITGAEQNFVLSLGSRPAYEILQETFEALPDSDKELAQGNIFAGLAVSEYVDEFKTGDFLVRNLLGADPEHGVLALGAYPRVGQTLQFQLRDRRSADTELRHLAAQKEIRPFASLLFPCSGRGKHLFGTANHDAEVLRETFGSHPSAGFFCNGEIGPVGGKNFVHGYTASAALFANL